MAADMLAGEPGEEGAVLLSEAGPLVVLWRFFVLTATGYRLPPQLAAPRETVPDSARRDRDGITNRKLTKLFR
jgi:hypothetical protein